SSKEYVYTIAILTITVGAVSGLGMIRSGVPFASTSSTVPEDILSAVRQGSLLLSGLMFAGLAAVGIAKAFCVDSQMGYACAFAISVITLGAELGLGLVWNEVANAISK